MKYMLDTNMCIYIIKKKPEKVLKKFIALDVGDVCISSITYAELMFGVYKSQHRQQNKDALLEFATPIEVMPFDDNIAEHYGELRAKLEVAGTPIGSLDTMIASHAQALNCILVTNNKKEFARVPNLALEDWVHG